MRALSVLVRRWRQYRGMSGEERRLFWLALLHLARLRRRLGRLSLAELLAGEGLVPGQAGAPAAGRGAPDSVRRARVAVTRAARALPFRTTCLVRSLAEMRVLARENIEAELCIGFRRGADGRLGGHAWVALDGGSGGHGSNNSVAARYRVQGASRDCS